MQTITTATQPRRIPDWALLATVFITGACVLVIELMGSRILAPYFGSGIYTWSALISITLAALALGYAFGGRLADRLPRADILYMLCLAAGLWTLSTPMLARPLLPMIIQIPDIRVGVLLSSLILYFPNLFMLGAIGPFIIRLMTSRREIVGSVSGRVFAVSTIGSLLGALATGFVLIPNFGVVSIFTACGILLLVIAILGNLRAKFIGYALILTCLVAGLMFLSASKTPPVTSLEIIDQEPSFYGQLQVVRKHGEMSLLVDGIGQNYVYNNDIYSTEYINFIAALPGLMRAEVTEGQKSLVIGMGAGQLSMLLDRNGLFVDTVEIDAKVGDMATRHFGFDLPSQQVHYMDGRLFLAQSRDSYEYIAIDAFSAEQIASHLVTAEALAQTRSRLTDNGVLTINVTSVATGLDIAALQHTLKSVFSHVRTFSLEDGSELTSIVMLASMSGIALDTGSSMLDETLLQDAKRFIEGEMPDLGSDVVLTDDFNPISHQRKHIQLLWREAMIDYLGKDNLSLLMP
jgi:spermidine synthase